jgi:hypothetical protein
MMGELTWTTVPNPRTSTNLVLVLVHQVVFQPYLFFVDVDRPGMGNEHRERKVRKMEEEATF